MNSYKILNDLESCIIINKASYLNPKLSKFLIENFSSLKDIKDNIVKIQQNFKINIESFQKTLNYNCSKEITYIKNNNVNILTLSSKNYPDYLKEIANNPVILFTKGNIECLNRPLFSIIGTRKPTEYAKTATSNISSKLSEYFCIVSGLALGIDSIAHESCVKEHNQTIAVLAHGIDSIHPKSNITLATNILNKKGLLISEFPLFSSPQKFHFPQRNRIISGLSQGLLITEATIKSGSMITANFAIEQNRDVFALPGNITNKNAEGPIHLIQQGAKCIYTVKDIFDEFNISITEKNDQQSSVKTVSHEQFNSTENKILSILTPQHHIDEIQEKTQLDLSTVLHTLTFLEIKSIIKKTSANTYILK